MSDGSSAPRDGALGNARERAVRVLTDRFADDTLSMDEFEARLDRMYQAATVADLDALLADVDHARPSAAVASPYDSRANRRVLSIMSATQRTGRWAMPGRMELRALMSSTILDLRDVALPAFCEIDLLAMWANVEILVRHGVVVEDLTHDVLANVENAALDDGTASANGPTLRITGTVVMSNVEVRVAPLGLSPEEAMAEAERVWRRRTWR